MTLSQPERRRPRLFWGVLLVTAGVALLLDPFLDPVQISAARLWPLPLIVLGFAKMTRGWPPRHRHGGPWLVMLGGWLLLNTLTDWEYSHTWPVLIMFLGVRLIWTSSRGRRELCDGTEPVHVD